MIVLGLINSVPFWGFLGTAVGALLTFLATYYKFKGNNRISEREQAYRAVEKSIELFKKENDALRERGVLLEKRISVLGKKIVLLKLHLVTMGVAPDDIVKMLNEE